MGPDGFGRLGNGMRDGMGSLFVQQVQWSKSMNRERR
jgi:hypothetical protein